MGEKPIITQAFKTSDGNGGHRTDVKTIKEYAIQSIFTSILGGVVLAMILGVFGWAKTDRQEIKDGLTTIKKEIVTNRQELITYAEVTAQINDVQTEAINRNTAYLAKKWNWNPCPPPLPTTAEIKKKLNDIVVNREFEARKLR